MTKEVEKIEKQMQQLKARLDKAKAKERAAARKHDTRIKIVLGGAVVKLVKEKKAQPEMMQEILKVLSEKDRALFTREWVGSVIKGD